MATDSQLAQTYAIARFRRHCPAPPRSASDAEWLAYDYMMRSIQPGYEAEYLALPQQPVRTNYATKSGALIVRIGDHYTFFDGSVLERAHIDTLPKIVDLALTTFARQGIRFDPAEAEQTILRAVNQLRTRSS